MFEVSSHGACTASARSAAGRKPPSCKTRQLTRKLHLAYIRVHAGDAHNLFQADLTDVACEGIRVPGPKGEL